MSEGLRAARFIVLVVVMQMLAILPARGEELLPGQPNPALASECTPAVPGVPCETTDPIGVGRVELHSGEYFLEEEDLRIPGRGIDFVMRRTYRSRGDRSAVLSTLQPPHWIWAWSHLGTGWDHTYNIWLESERRYQPITDSDCGPPGSSQPCWEDVSQARVRMGNGRTSWFTRRVDFRWHDWNHNGVWDRDSEPPIGNVPMDFRASGQWTVISEVPPNDRFHPTDLGGFTLRHQDGSVWHFRTHYRLPTSWGPCENLEDPDNTVYCVRWETPAYSDSFRAVCDWIEDPNGNRMYLEWELGARLSEWGHSETEPVLRQVIDTLGRVVRFDYATTEAGPPESGESPLTYLRSVTDSAGHAVHYEVVEHGPARGQLRRVEGLKASEGSPNGGQGSGDASSSRRVRVYEWSDGGMQFPHLGVLNLKAIRDGDGRLLASMTYSTGISDFTQVPPDPIGVCGCVDENAMGCRNERENYDRVLSHTIGDGTMHFEYARVPDTVSGPCVKRPIWRVTVTDPVGNVTVTDLTRKKLVSRKREYLGRALPGVASRAESGPSGEVVFVSNPPGSQPPTRPLQPALLPGLKVENGLGFYETITDTDFEGQPFTIMKPNATARYGPGQWRVDEVKYFYDIEEVNAAGGPCSATSYPSGGPYCIYDPGWQHDVDHGIACTWAMPRIRVRRAPDPFMPGDATCLIERTTFDSDRSAGPFGATVDLRGSRGLTLETYHPNRGSRHFYHDDRGNLLRVGVHGTRSEPAAILDRYEYADVEVADPRDPSGHRMVRRMTAHEWPEHIVDGAAYRQRDEYRYYEASDCPDPTSTSHASCPQYGLLKEFVEDVAALHQTTRFEYDTVGRLERKTDAAGNVTSYVRDGRGLVIREEVAWRHAGGQPGQPLVTERRHDANGQLVRVDVPNLALGGALDPSNPYWTTITKRDRLGRPVAVLQELASVDDALLDSLSDSAQWETLLSDPSVRDSVAVTRTHYGPDGKVTLIENPEAVAGRRPGDVLATEHDERGLPLRTTTGIGADTLVTQVDYDGNRNPIRQVVGINTSAPRLTRHVYDGFDRLRVTIDPMGNERHRTYSGDLLAAEYVLGEVDDQPGGASNVCLSVRRVAYDWLARDVGEHVALFDDPPPTCTELLADGDPARWASTTRVLSVRGQAIEERDPLGRVTRLHLDTLGRNIGTTDAVGDEIVMTLDANGVPTRTERQQQSGIGAPVRTIITEQRADTLGRVTESVDPAGHLTTVEYGAGKRVLRSTDARGHNVRFTSDGAGRVIETRRELWESGAFIRDVVTRTHYDLDGRVIGQEDDGGNLTETVRDDLGRVTATRMADNTEHASRYSTFGDLIESVDANGTVLAHEPDALGRTRRRWQVSAAPGVTPVAAQRFTLDGLGRMRAYADEAVNGRAVTLRLNSRGAVIEEESSDGHSTHRLHATDGSLLASCYGLSGTQVRNVRDDAGRVTEVWLDEDWTASSACGIRTASERLLLRQYWSGPRLERREFENGIRLDIQHDMDLLRAADRVYEPVGSGQMQLRSARTYVHDDVHHRSVFASTEQNVPGLWWTHDSLRRMRTSRRDLELPRRYDLDGAQNRLAVHHPSGQTETYSREPSDAPVHQYTTAGGASLAHDLTGAVTEVDYEPGQDGLDLRLTWDAVGLPSTLTAGPPASPTAVLSFRHDALGRRIGKDAVVAGQAGRSSTYWLDGERIVEEVSASGDVTLRVYGPLGLDDLVYQSRGGQRLTLLTDAQSSVVTAMDAAGHVLERYLYADYGGRSVATGPAGAFEEGRASALGVEQGFTGAWLDAEVGLYWLRTRPMDPRMGRFLRRDPAGIWADAMGLGNGYQYAANDPATLVDPMGLMVVNPDGMLGGLPGDCTNTVVCGQRPDVPAATPAEVEETGTGEKVAEIVKPGRTARFFQALLSFLEGTTDGEGVVERAADAIIGVAGAAAEKADSVLPGRHVGERVRLGLRDRGADRSDSDHDQMLDEVGAPNRAAEYNAIVPDIGGHLASGAVNGGAHLGITGMVARPAGSGPGRRGSFAAQASDNLRRMGLEGLDLAGRSYNSGRKALENAGFVLDRTTSSGRRVFRHSGTGAEVWYDSGRALAPQQGPHWHIVDAGGQRYGRSGRPVASDDVAGHIPGG